MDTKRKIKKIIFKKKFRKKHKRNNRRNYRRNHRKKTSNLLTMILLTLLVFNIGAFIYLMNSDKIGKDITFKEVVLDMFYIRKGSTQEAENDAYSNPEEHAESDRSKDIIIENLEEYENLIIVEEGPNLENVPEPVNVETFTVDKEKEYIFAYHTHTTESFLADDGSYYNTDPNNNIVAIGETITTILEGNGHNVNHETTVHDLPSFNQSYSRSKETIIKNKEDNPNLKVFLDIHRDGVDNNAPHKDEFLKTAAIDIDGVSTGTFSLVVGPDLENYDEVLNFAKYIKAVSDVLYPNLCKGIIVKPVGKFNLQYSDHAALLEIGSNLITIEEADETAKRVGEILSIALDKLIVE